jgi:holliday junction DNA helicase RuvB
MNDYLDPIENDLDENTVSLRPQKLSEIIGRQAEKKNLEVLIESAKMRNQAVDHILLHGPPGLGKTSLAQVIAKEIGADIYTTTGAAIEKKGDLASILTNIENKGILFIDEIHRLQKVVEEILYSAMEDGVIDIVIGKGPSARTLKLELNNITIIGATTRVSMLSAPLRDRFGVDLRLDYYSYEEMAQLVKQKSKILDMNIDDVAAFEIARRSRRTPRIAVRILKRVRDLAIVEGQNNIDKNIAIKALNMINIDDHGLDYLDRKILNSIITNFNGGPVGLNTLAASISEEIDTIRDVYEPFLLQEGFIIRGSRGRQATEKAIDYLNNSKFITK